MTVDKLIEELQIISANGNGNKDVVYAGCESIDYVFDRKHEVVLEPLLNMD